MYGNRKRDKNINAVLKNNEIKRENSYYSLKQKRF